MTPRTILACLTTRDQADSLMLFAVSMARKYNAHLIGLHATETVHAFAGAEPIPASLLEMLRESQKEEEAKTKAIFDAHIQNEDFPSEYRVIPADRSSAKGSLVDHVRSADLIVLSGGVKNAEGPAERNAPIRVIRESGRPVIVAPPNYPGSAVGKSIVVAWNGSSEAARAAHDMLLIADKGAAVSVLRVGGKVDNAMEDAVAIDLAEVLSRHGLQPSLDYREPADGSIAAALNQFAFERGADLIVAGAFGHSRAYDFIIGATTSALLKGAQLPVLFSK